MTVIYARQSGSQRAVQRGSHLLCRVHDNPFIHLDTRRIRDLGWQPQLSIKDAVIRTLDWLRANPWVLEQRT